MRILVSIAAAAIPLLLSSDGKGRVSEPPTHPAVTAVGRLRGFTGRPFAVHVTRLGDVLVTEQDIDRVMHLDPLLKSASENETGAHPGDVIANHAGTLAYVSGFQDGTIGVVDLAGDSTIVLIELPTRNAYRLTLSPNESRLYVTSTEGRLFVLNTGTRVVSSSSALGGALQGMALDHAGANLYVSSTGGEVWRLDRPSLTTKRGAKLDCQAQDIALAIDDTELYVACERGSIAVLDPVSLETISVIPVPTGSAFGLAVTPDNAQLYVSAPPAGYITILDRASRRVVRNVHVEGLPRRIAFSPRGDKAYISNEWNWISVVE